MRNNFEAEATPLHRGQMALVDSHAARYREIGISAVAAALRFTTQPEPAKKHDDASHPGASARRTSVAA